MSWETEASSEPGISQQENGCSEITADEVWFRVQG